jgi:hypothetical protein
LYFCQRQAAGWSAVLTNHRLVDRANLNSAKLRRDEIDFGALTFNR